MVSKSKRNRSAAVLKTPWGQPTLSLYGGLKKHESTALFQLRSEVIGLNAWLASVGVPDISPRCTCGVNAQTVKHILFYCPEHVATRARMFRDAGTSSFDSLLQSVRGCRAAERMVISTGRLSQFVIANQIEHEEQDLAKIPVLN